MESADATNGAWKGGPCPRCGDDMPPRVVHCQTCRVLLNSELSEDSVEIPIFVPLPEIAVVSQATPRGHYVQCPGCQEELRIHSKYRGHNVQCKHCQTPFTYSETVTVLALYTPCPHCESELRAHVRYIGQKVACKFCGGHIELVAATK